MVYPYSLKKSFLNLQMWNSSFLVNSPVCQYLVKPWHVWPHPWSCHPQLLVTTDLIFSLRVWGFPECLISWIANYTVFWIWCLSCNKVHLKLICVVAQHFSKLLRSILLIWSKYVNSLALFFSFCLISSFPECWIFHQKTWSSQYLQFRFPEKS